MSLLTNSLTTQEVVGYITGAYTLIDLCLTKGEKLMDHSYRIYKKLQKFKKKHDIPKLGNPSP